MKKLINMIAQTIKNICPECDESSFSIEGCFFVCRNCGFTLNLYESEVIIDPCPIRTDPNHDVCYTGNLVPDISYLNVVKITPNTPQKLKYALNRGNQKSWKEKRNQNAYLELKRIGFLLDLPHYIKEYAAHLFQQVIVLDILRGNSIDGMIAVCLFFSCRHYDVPRSLTQFLEIVKESPKVVKRCLKAFLQEMKLELPRLNPISMLSQYINILGLSFSIEQKSRTLLKRYLRKNLALGKDPKGLTAAAIYLSCTLEGLSISQKQIATLIHTTDTTLRNRVSELMNIMPIQPGMTGAWSVLKDNRKAPSKV